MADWNAIDWNAIKLEYITDPTTSYRKLAEKYGVHYKVIGAKGKEEKWCELRSQHKDKILTNTLDAISNEQVDRATRLISVSDLLLTKVETLLQDEEMLLVNPQSLKHISGVLKDIKDIQMIKSDADMREQEARIANLRRQAEQEDSNDVTITFVGGEASWRE